MRTLYSLNSCNTCQRICKELNLPRSVTIVNIKVEPLTAEVLERLKNLAGSYEALFSKRAQLYKKCNLKRPVLIYDEKIFIGNSKAVVAAAKKWVDEH